MKKAIALVLATFFFMVSASLVLADSGKPQNAMDLVIVIDQSNSMKNGSTPSDPQDYRLDAAQILLSMLDTKNSNAGVVMFARNLVESDVLNRLYPMSVIENRTMLIQEIERRGVNTYPDTDIGEAMKMAQSMLSQSRTDNEKVIVLITDGQIEVGEETARSQKDVIDVINYASNPSHPIKINTVYLEYNSKDDTKLIRQMSDRTGGTFNYVDKRAADLPAVFNNIFSSQIGSDLVTVDLNSMQDDIQRGAGYHKVELTVPNRSIKEINVVVSTDGIDQSSIAIFKPDGSEAKADNKALFAVTTRHYNAYKIIEPTPSQNGKNWRLSFSGNVGNVNIQYVFSYDVGTAVHLEKETQAKSEPFGTRAWFTQNDSYSSDDTLYSSINAHLSVRKIMADGRTATVLQDVPMGSEALGDVTIYRTQIDDLRQTLGQYYSAGRYEAQVRFSGAGLARESDWLSFTLVNDAPVVRQAAEDMSFTFHDHNVKGKMNMESATLDLGACLQDANGDTLTWKVIDCPKGLTVAPEGGVLEPSGAGDNLLTVAQQGVETSGDIIIEANDGDGGTVQLRQHVQVIDMDNQYGPFGLQMTIDGADKNNTGIVSLSKGQQVTLRVTPVKDGAPVQDDVFGLEVTNNGAAVPIIRQSDGSYTGSFTANNVITMYNLSATGKFGSAESGTPRSTTLTAQVKNNDPTTTGAWSVSGPASRMGGGGVLATLLSKPQGNVYWIEPFVLDEPTGEITVDLADYFTDADGDQDVLTYSASLDGDDFELAEGHLLVLSDQKLVKGFHELVVSAADLDQGERATESVSFSVYSLKQRENRTIITLAVALAALIVLILIIRYILLPVYPKSTKLRLFISGMPQDYEKRLPSRIPASKRKRALSTYYDASINRGTNGAITQAMLKNIILSPARRKKVRVTLGKNASRNVTVSVGGRQLSKKQKSAIMGVGQRISVSVEPYTVEYQLQNR